VPVASLEEARVANLVSYECCTFRGNIVSLDAVTGKQIWKTYTVPEPQKTAKTDAGVPALGTVGRRRVVDARARR